MIFSKGSLLLRARFLRVCIKRPLNTNTTTIHNLLDELSRLTKNGTADSFQKKIREIKNTEKRAFHTPQMQKTIASIAHDLKTLKKYKELDLLSNELSSAGYKFSNGTQSTFFKSYIDRKLWAEAMNAIDVCSFDLF